MSSQSHRCSSYSKRSSQQSSISSHNMSKQSNSFVSSSEIVKSESITQNLHGESSSVKNFSQKVSSNSSISSSVTITSNNQSVNFGIDEVDYADKNQLAPPAIPQKTRRKERQSSPYDNVSDGKIKSTDLKNSNLIIISNFFFSKNT